MLAASLVWSAACHDFDDAYLRCFEDGRCEDAGAQDAGQPPSCVGGRCSPTAVAAQTLYGPVGVASGQTTFTATRTIDPGSLPNTVLVVGIDLSAHDCGVYPTVSAVTDDKGQTYAHFATFATDLASCPAGQTATDLEVWYTSAPANGGTTLTVALPSPAAGNLVMSFGATAFAGVDASTPLRSQVSLAQKSGPAIISVAVTTTPGDLVSEIACNGTQVGSPAGSPRQTLDWSNPSVAVTCASGWQGSVGASGTTYDDAWTVVNDNSAILAFDVAGAP